jgi:hypothetical protein
MVDAIPLAASKRTTRDWPSLDMFAIVPNLNGMAATGRPDRLPFSYFKPPLTPEELGITRIEGWILGVV